MKTLVTGGCGFIGSHVVDALIEAGHEVDVIDDLSTGKHDNLNPKAHLDVVKIQDIDDGGWDGYDAVFHLAARARIQPSIEDPAGYIEANVLGTARALDIARKSKARFIFSSSSSVYGCDEKVALQEDRKLNPLNPYALTKAMGEELCEIYRRLYGIKTTVLRYFNVYGPRQAADGPYSTVIGIFQGQKERGDALTIVGDGEQRRDFTYVGDVVAANLLGLQATGTFNVGSGKNVSVNDVANAIAGENYPRTKISRAAEVKQTLANNGRLQALGWRSSVNVLDWLKENS